MEFDIRGWIGIAWDASSPNHLSSRMNYYAGVLNSSTQVFRIVDGYATSTTQIYQDPGTNLENGQASRVGSTTYMSFTRKLSTPGDTAILTGTTYLIWCYHSDDTGFDTKTKHDYYGSTQVNFFTGIVFPGFDQGPKRTTVVSCGVAVVALSRKQDYASVQPFFRNLLTAAGIVPWRALIFDISQTSPLDSGVTPLVRSSSSLDTAEGVFLTILTLPNYRSVPAETKSTAQLVANISAAILNMPPANSLAILGRGADAGNTTQPLVTCMDDQNVPFYWATMPCPVAAAGGGVFQSSKDNYTLSWTIIPGKPSGVGVITFTMKALTLGWLGMCISDTQNHHRSGNVDCYVGWMQGTVLNFKDYTAHDHNTVPVLDTGKTILSSSVTVDNGTTTIKWSRQLAPVEPADVNLDQSIDFNLLWAHHPIAADYTAARGHDSFGAIRVNFVSGSIVELPPTTMAPQTSAPTRSPTTNKTGQSLIVTDFYWTK